MNMRRAGVLLCGILLPGALLASLSWGQDSGETDDSEVPLGLPREHPGLVPAPRRAALVALGRRLFGERALSVDRSTACMSCHPPDRGFASPRRFPVGAHGRVTPRSAPTLINRALGKSFGWRGGASTIEEQILLTFDDVNEFDFPLEEALARLAADEEYLALFAAVSGEKPDAATLSAAVAEYVRTILVGNSPVDRFLNGDVSGLTREERQGMWIFDSKGGCWQCHAGAGNFTDERFHNTGVGAVDGVPAAGRFAVTGIEADRGRFKTPTLRAVAHTAPYMHDGSFATLEEVVEFYRAGGGANANLDPLLRPRDLTDREAADLVAFLRALSRE